MVGHVKVQQGRRGLKLEVYSLLSSLQFMFPISCMDRQNGSLFSASHVLLNVYSARQMWAECKSTGSRQGLYLKLTLSNQSNLV